jgi:hypothetical protein
MLSDRTSNFFSLDIFKKEAKQEKSARLKIHETN